MAVSAISREAYRKHIFSGRALKQWQKVYGYIQTLNSRGIAPTRAEVSERLNIRLSSVCGRVCELKNAELITDGPRRICTITKEPAHPLYIAFGPVSA